MKKMKKLVSLLLTLVMVAAMAVSVSADDTTTYTITIEGSMSASGTTESHTYSAYQVFAGDLATDGTTLSNVTWGTGVNSTSLLTAVKAITDGDDTPFANCSTAAEVAEVLGGYSDNSDVAKAFATAVSNNLADTASGSASTTNDSGNYVISNLTAGYYFVKDSASLDGLDAAATRYILEVVSNVTVTPKSDTPTVTKKVKETNDTTNTTSTWQDAADYDINDTIPYQLTGTLPDVLSDYSTYAYTFTDTMSVGLTYSSDSVKVYVVTGDDKTEVASSGYTASTTTIDSTATSYAGGTTLTVAISDVKSLKDTSGAAITVTSDSTIVVEYSATLNSNAVIGSAGNPNEVYLTYSNNPNGSGTGKTPTDKVIVFTYEIDANKVREATAEDETSNSTVPLSGAGFTLYKLVDGTYTIVGSEVTGGTTFTFQGVDAGTYKLVETTVPDGYNKADDVIFNIVATYTDSSDDPSLSALSVTNSENTTISGENGSFTATSESGIVSTDILNQKGSVLPTTGGMGTTILYVIGTILVLGAAILLVTKKRMSSER
ncbi:MAG: isopeptide-forming domain-containing fimbrial protein [Lachnospiraceae bacterium]|nr:isopeptide-forming domain-containing fimbrial protein [Lachnospiraceae bacterium]